MKYLTLADIDDIKILSTERLHLFTLYWFIFSDLFSRLLVGRCSPLRRIPLIVDRLRITLLFPPRQYDVEGRWVLSVLNVAGAELPPVAIADRVTSAVTHSCTESLIATTNYQQGFLERIWKTLVVYCSALRLLLTTGIWNGPKLEGTYLESCIDSSLLSVVALKKNYEVVSAYGMIPCCYVLLASY